jgi:hypothetical protein
MGKKSLNHRGLLGILLIMVISWPPGASVFSQESEEVVDEVLLFVREAELLAFSATGSKWVSADLRAKERVLKSKYGGHIAVVVTDSRVLGFSALTSTWSIEKLRAGEELLNIEVTGHVAAIVTNLRAFGFSAKSGVWVEKRLDLEIGGDPR